MEDDVESLGERVALSLVPKEKVPDKKPGQPVPVWEAFGLPESSAVRFYTSKDPLRNPTGLTVAEKRSIVAATGKSAAWRKRHRLRESDLRHKENRAARRASAAGVHDIKEAE